MAIPLGALAAIAQKLLFGVTGLTALTDVAVEDPVDRSGRRRCCSARSRR